MRKCLPDPEVSTPDERHSGRVRPLHMSSLQVLLEVL